MMKHFAYFHRPGSTRLDIAQSQLPSGVNAIASTRYSSTSKQQRWSVLFMNNQTSAYKLTLQTPGQHANLTQVVQTTGSADWYNVTSLPAVTNGQVAITLPGQSLVTLVFAQ